MTSKFTIQHFLGIDTKLKELEEQLHQQALLTPDPSDDTLNYLDQLRGFADQAIITRMMPDWFKDIMVYLMAVVGEGATDIVNGLFRGIYKLITSVVLFTPEWIFGNDWFPQSVAKFSALSVGLIVILSMFEGLKRILGLRHTSLVEISKKLPIALTVSAATPFLFLHGLRFLNWLTRLVLQINSNDMTQGTFQGFSAVAVMYEPVNIFFMILFLILTAILTVPLMLRHSRRWFEMLCVGTLTPIAMCCWLFKSTEEYFHIWLETLKKVSFVQLAYAVFITIMGLLIFATPNPITFAGFLSKAMISVGAMHVMAFPPSFVKRITPLGKDNAEIYHDFKQKYEKTKEKYQGHKDLAIGEVNNEGVRKGGYVEHSVRILGKAYRFLNKK